MKCLCCDRDIFIRPKVRAIYDEENNKPIIIKRKHFLYEKDDFVEYEDILTEDEELRAKTISVTLDEEIFINKNFCEECYNSFLKNKIDDLIESLSFFKNKKE